MTLLCTSMSLNPCFNGRYSQSHVKTHEVMAQNVLILVLMEDTLRDDNLPDDNQQDPDVLILVLMEDTLRGE